MEFKGKERKEGISEGDREGMKETRKKENRKRWDIKIFLKRCKTLCLRLIAELPFYHFKQIPTT